MRPEGDISMVLADDTDPKWIWSYDDGIVHLLKFLGVSSPLIIGLVIFAFALKSWIDAFSSAVSAAKKLRNAASGVALPKLTLTQRFVGSSLVTALVVLAQGATLYLLVLAGLMASALEETVLGSNSTGRGNVNYQLFQSAWNRDGFFGVVSPQFVESLQFDSFAIPIAILGAVGLIGSYVLVRSDRGVFYSALIMTVPFAAWLCLYTPFLLIGIGFEAIAGATPSPTQLTKLLISMLALCYCVVALVVASASRIVVRSWIPPVYGTR